MTLETQEQTQTAEDSTPHARILSRQAYEEIFERYADLKFDIDPEGDFIPIPVQAVKRPLGRTGIALYINAVKNPRKGRFYDHLFRSPDSRDYSYFVNCDHKLFGINLGERRYSSFRDVENAFLDRNNISPIKVVRAHPGAER